ncbi:dihydrofolate reductase family protein [Streptacidiphilus cavernicola]|uniref:Dihydrofolate reductase family protein n=1 Tax=Streptacidiphilus cavernicola TaxID=3342716 RepID=A0ABV6VQR1_9ACTN
MSRIATALSVSLDGYIAGPQDGPGQPLGAGGRALFDWYNAGDTPSRFYPAFRMSRQSAEFFDAGAAEVGAVIAGRRTYDIADGWAGKGPLPGVPLFVLTHRAPEPVPPNEEYTFVTDGVESAVAQAGAAIGAAADGRDVVGVMGAGTVQACLRAGLLDELTLHLVPIVLGAGVRLLDHLDPARVQLDCIGVVDAPGVTHLSYRISYPTAA